jgi:hypothetical protein
MRFHKHFSMGVQPLSPSRRSVLRRLDSGFASNRAISARPSSNGLAGGVGCCSGGKNKRFKATKKFTGKLLTQLIMLREAPPVWSFQFNEKYAYLETDRVNSFFRVTSSLNVVIVEGGG